MVSAIRFPCSVISFVAPGKFSTRSLFNPIIVCNCSLDKPDSFFNSFISSSISAIASGSVSSCNLVFKSKYLANSSFVREDCLRNSSSFVIVSSFASCCLFRLSAYSVEMSCNLFISLYNPYTAPPNKPTPATAKPT